MSHHRHIRTKTALQGNRRRKCGASLAALCATLLVGTSYAATPAAAGTTYTFNIPSQRLIDSLQALALASHYKLLYSSELVTGKKAPALQGKYTIEQALRLLLSGTNLRYQVTPDGLVLVRAPGAATPPKAKISSPSSSSATPTRHDDSYPPTPPAARNAAGEPPLLEPIALPEILVMGSYITNLDIVRTENDVQPYTIFTAEQIQQSGATTVEGFLQQQLSSNSTYTTNSSVGNYSSGGLVSYPTTTDGATSSINLRGLGTNETLILIDGQRVAGATGLSVAGTGAAGQPDVNGIPLSAIDKIEVLSSSASAIYGGAAMGGVVNIILKRYFSDGDLSYTYDNVFSGSAPEHSVSASYGTSFFGGKTQVMLAGTYSHSSALPLHDRASLMERGINAVQANTSPLSSNPSFYEPPYWGTTPNIVSADGSNLILNDGTPLNSPYTSIPAGAAAGANLSSGLLASAARYNLTFPPTAGFFGQTPEIKSLLATIRQSISKSIELYVNLSTMGNSSDTPTNPIIANQLVPAGTPTNPFEQDVSISFPTPLELPDPSNSITRSATAGLVVKLDHGWSSQIDYTWSQNTFHVTSANLDSQALFLALATGTLNPFVDTLAHPLNLRPYLNYLAFSQSGTLNDTNVRFAGPVGSLPAGRPTLTIGLEHRREGQDTGYQVQTTPDAPEDNSEAAYFGHPMSTSSAYLESLVPLIAPRNAVPAVHSLDLQLAARTERYTVHSGTNEYFLYPLSEQANTPLLPPTTVRYTSTNYTVGLKYQPTADFMFRASYATAFLPPTPQQLAPGALEPFQPRIFDPRLNESYLVNWSFGGNPNLQPQTAKSLDVGLIWEPQESSLLGVRADLEYYHISQPNYIETPDLETIIDTPSLSSFVIRDPTTGLITQVNQAYANITSYVTDGFDLALDYVRATSFGTFDFHAAGTWIRKDLRQTAVGVAASNFAGYPDEGGEVKLKANASLTWKYHGVTLGWLTHYYGSYYGYGAPDDPLAGQSGDLLPFVTPFWTAQGSTSIPSQTYHDIFASYTTAGATPYWLGNITLQASIDNVFNSAPAFDSSGPYYLSPLGDPRLRAYRLTVTKVF